MTPLRLNPLPRVRVCACGRAVLPGCRDGRCEACTDFRFDLADDARDEIEEEL